MALSLAPAPAPTLQNFVGGRNTELMSLLNALARGARVERFVYIWGVPACGKTHLLRAMCGAFEQHDVADARIMTEKYINKFAKKSWKEHRGIVSVAGYET